MCGFSQEDCIASITVLYDKIYSPKILAPEFALFRSQLLTLDVYSKISMASIPCDVPLRLSLDQIVTKKYFSAKF